MARYRLYKNGIYGHRHNGLYIIKGEKGKYLIINDKKETIEKNIYDYNEAEWIIDKLTISNEELEIIKKLYNYEIFELNSLLMELMQKNEKDEKNLILYKWCEKVRKRKVEKRKF